MAIIAPLRGITYNFDRFSDISALITPPYDVISERERDSFYDAHPNNIIRAILGKKNQGDSDCDNCYTRAGNYLKEWESSGILVRSNESKIYLTSHRYDPEDGSGPRVRWGFISLVRIEDEGSSVILPHEKTFSAHKDDRLKLMKASSFQLSQVFGLYDDAGSNILDDLKKSCKGSIPATSFDFRDNTSHSMWEISDVTLIGQVSNAMKNKPIFIADGHHRYETTRNYRDLMRLQHGSGSRSYEYVMMYLTDMGDKGLTILPTHRLVVKCSDFDMDEFIQKSKEWFCVEDISLEGVNRDNINLELKEILSEKGRNRIAFICYSNRDSIYRLMSLRPGAMDDAKDMHPSLAKLDVSVLSHLMLERCLGFTKEDLDNDRLIRYNSNISETVSLVDSKECEMAFILNPTKMEHVREIAGNYLTMPRKSTYFFPKVLTGLILNRIDPNENIEVS